jgi:hypothetical protein
VACGALVRELRSVLAQLDTADHPIDVEYLPANLHNRPEKIAGAVRDVLDQFGRPDDRVVFGYGDCGTGGRLDSLAADVGATRLTGAHCYEFMAGAAEFAALHEAEPGTFYLTDFLARHFDSLVVGGLGLDRHPQLRDVYFANYHRLVYLSQSDDPALLERAEMAADRLGLAFEHRPTGLAPFADAVAVAVTTARRRTVPEPARP